MKIPYRFIQKINPRQVHVSVGGKYFIASFALPQFAAREVLVFEADKEGNILSYAETDASFEYDDIDSWVANHCYF